MKKKESRIVVYCIGFIIIISVWLILYAGELSAFNLLKTALLLLLSYIAMAFDINTKRIPNTLVLTMIAGWLLMILPIVITETEYGLRLMLDSTYGMLTGGGLFMLVYLISSKGLGGGDVKFMAAAGLYLGFAKTIPAILYATVLAAIVGVILILIKKIGRKDTIPLVPFLFAGIVITIFVQ